MRHLHRKKPSCMLNVPFEKMSFRCCSVRLQGWWIGDRVIFCSQADGSGGASLSCLIGLLPMVVLGGLLSHLPRSRKKDMQLLRSKVRDHILQTSEVEIHGVSPVYFQGAMVAIQEELLQWNGYHGTIAAMPEMDGWFVAGNEINDTRNAVHVSETRLSWIFTNVLHRFFNLMQSWISCNEAKGRDFLYYRSQHHQKEEALKFGSNGAKWGLQSSSRCADSFSSRENSQHRLVHVSTLWCLW